MAAEPSVGIRDDGELDDVRALLSEMKVEYVEGETVEPTRLLVSSPRHAVRENGVGGRHGSQGRKRLHIVVVTDAASRSLQRLLERSDCDVVVRQPVHPTALRLLVQRALFGGEERRQLERVAIGAPIKLKGGLLSRPAILAEISLRGCGIVTSQRFSRGDVVHLTLPAALTGAKPRSLCGRVVGVQAAPTGEASGHAVAVVFERLDSTTLREIRNLMVAHGLGPTRRAMVAATASGSVAPNKGAPAEMREAAPNAAPPAKPQGRERRQSRRGVYNESILAQADGRTHALIGCDLSTGGMRIGFDSDLELGMVLRLALYGQAGIPPVIVKAEVVRDGSEEDGFGLRFGPLPEAAQQRLEQLVASLPDVDSDSRKGLVVSEVLERVGVDQ